MNRRIHIALFSSSLFLVLILVSCTKRKDTVTPPDIVSWTKPVLFRDEYTTVENLSKKSDEGFLASGYLSYINRDATDGFLINFDQNGDTIWCRKVNMENYPDNIVLFAIQKSVDEIIVAGVCSYSSFKKQRFIAWLESRGNITKSVIFPLADNQSVSGFKVIPLDNGNIYYAMNGRDNQVQGIGGNTLTIDLLDNNGGIIRSKSYPGIFTELEHLYLINTDNLLIVGSSSITDTDSGDIMMLLADGSGSEVYRRSFGTNAYDIGYSACSDNIGGFMVSGMITNLSKPVIYHVTSTGIPENKVDVTTPVSSMATIIKPGTNGGYNLIAQTSSRVYFMKLGSDLSILNTSYFENPGGLNYSYDLRDVFHMSDGSFAFLYFNEVPVIIKTIPFD
jgi:hypothetical protein